MSHVYRPDDPVEDERNQSVAQASQYAPSTVHTAYQPPAESSSAAVQREPIFTEHLDPVDDSILGTSPDTYPDGTPIRGATIKKKGNSVRRGVSRASSKRSIRMQPVRRNVNPDADFYNVFNVPIPTTGNPTEVLANRFQAWRKLLKDLIVYFQEIRMSYTDRSKATMRMVNIINATSGPQELLRQGGINDAIGTLRNFHKIALSEANRARDIEDDVITQLNGLRNDLNQKIKEIRGLSGDFRSNVDKERESTRRMIESLKSACAHLGGDSAGALGKGDPYIIRLGVERQVEKQMNEETYLHQAYLNLENSGRELESIVVGEIQKAYNAYATILNKEVTSAHNVVDELRSGPIAMPKDHEWSMFVENNSNFVNPGIPVRSLQSIHYPEQNNPIAAEIRGGTLERKSKYLKSYTPGWYVLSPTHLHEFKSADHLHTQQPVMSLYLADQKLGSHSQAGASSHKFSLKGRQAGGIAHRGHSWVFRAETYDTMLQWYSDIKTLTEKSGEERMAFVKKHVRTVSTNSKAFSTVSDGLQDDEADEVPYNATLPAADTTLQTPKRPEAGGRIPSDISVNRNSVVPAESISSHVGQDLGSAAGGPAMLTVPASSRQASVSTRGPNATSNFQRPPEFPERYRDTASIYTGGKKSRPTSSYYPESAEVAQQQQKYQEEPLPYAANEARPRSNMGLQPQQDPVLMPVPVAVQRRQAEPIAQTDYAEKKQGSRAASASRAQHGDARQRHENPGYRSQSAGFSNESATRYPAVTQYNNVPTNNGEMLVGVAGGAAVGAVGYEAYSRFNNAQQALAGQEPVNAVEHNEPLNFNPPQQNNIEHERSAPYDAYEPMTPETIRHQPLLDHGLAPVVVVGHEATDSSTIEPASFASAQEPDSFTSAVEQEPSPIHEYVPTTFASQSYIEAEPSPEHEYVPTILAAQSGVVSRPEPKEYQNEIVPQVKQSLNEPAPEVEHFHSEPVSEAKEVQANLAPQTSASSYQYGDFRILGADAHESYYAEKRLCQSEPVTEAAPPAFEATQPLSEPEIFQGDQLPDESAALAASNTLVVPTEQSQFPNEYSPTSEYDETHPSAQPFASQQHNNLQSPTSDTLSTPPLAHSVHDSAVDNSTPPTSTGTATPTTKDYTDPSVFNATAMTLQSPYPIIPGPAPYHGNPELTASSFPAGTDATDQLLKEAAATEDGGVGKFEAKIEMLPVDTHGLEGLLGRVGRTDTSMSASDLHVPGGFPKANVISGEGWDS